MPSDTNTRQRKRNIIFVHPDLGIGGAERLILDAALVLQARGHHVIIYTSHRDPTHCFDEARDGTLDVRVRGNSIFPAHVGGKLHVLMAILRQLHLSVALLREGKQGRNKVERRVEDSPRKENKGVENGQPEDEVFIVDQLPACIPILKMIGPWAAASGTQMQRILFYCHFPDQLLARRNQGSWLIRLLKACYRYPFDLFEGWAMSGSDKVVVNSNFTRGVATEVFGNGLGDVKVVYPCVDTEVKKGVAKDVNINGGGKLWNGLKVVLSINRFERTKDIALAIRAYHGLGTEERKGTRLVIAGGYDNRVQENVQYHKELDALATSLGLQTATSKTVISALSIPDSVDVLFLLSVPTAFKETLLSSAKLLVYTPPREHFGIVPVEAMYAGLPVLAANTGGPLETITEGETGWLRNVNSTNEWTEVMKKALWSTKEEDLARMARNGKARVEKEFSRHAMGESLEKEIQQMFDVDRRPFIDIQQLVLGVALVGAVMAGVITMALKVSS
ncbi:Alpha-1,3-mannosyltransferase-like protein [Arachnomyces sp. PD_36]|nr:Alpha-1,3-mannosyltransferase-like protein [Arachnomyces sp. PD_36]